jgi:hypothetical protein
VRYLVVVLFLAGCATPATFSPGTLAVQHRLLVDATGWNRFTEKEGAVTEFWTVDGIALDRLRFFVAVAEGQSLAEPLGKRPLPAFSAAMSPHEIVELYQAFATEDASVFTVTRLSPARFLGSEGFRFEFDLTRRMDDLALRGLGYGAVVDARLYLVIYSAPELYYFERHLPAAEAAIASARLAPALTSR